MAFKLRNRVEAFQKCVHIVLENQIKRNVKAYIDEIVVKLKKRGDLLDDLKEAFDNLRKYKMMLNAKKCVFGVLSGKLLGYMVSSRGIDANPTKVKAIEKLQRPEAGRYDGSPQRIHIQIGRARHAVLQAFTQCRWFAMGRSSCSSPC
jgi:hypothetical protein